MKLLRLGKCGAALGACGALLTITLLPVTAAASGTNTHSGEGDVVAGESVTTTTAGRECVKSRDSGERGAKGCFVDDGDDWYVCDIHEGGSGIAMLTVQEYNRKHGKLVDLNPLEQDDASDGTTVLGDCDEGKETNINEGNWIRLEVCIRKNGDKKQGTCNVRWIAE